MFGNVSVLRGFFFYVREEKEEMLVFSPLQSPKGMYIYCYPQDFSWPSLWKILLVKESCMPVSSSFTCHGAAAFQSC